MNIERLVQAIGGARKTAEVCGVTRTAPYGWVKRGFISQRMLEKIKSHAPHLDLDDFFEEDENEDDAGCSTGVP